MARVAAQIHRDVDPHVACQLRHRMIGHGPHVDERVETGRHPRRHRVAGVRAEGEPHGVKPRTVVVLEQADRQLGNWMLPKIR